MEGIIMRQGRSLAETPTYSVASVVTVLVFVCFFVQRAIYRFGKWLKKTKRKALFASLEKIKEELMLLGLISLLLAQWARGISEICVKSSLFSSKFYICSEKDYGINSESSFSFSNESEGINFQTTHQCGEGREPFVSLEGLEQLHRFLFLLGITHVLYSCLAVALSMSKLVMLVGTKLEHVVSSMALEIMEQTGPATGTQVKPRDDLFWFRKPEILLRLIQFIIFQNAFEMATFLWSLWGLKERSCFMKNHYMITLRLASGVLVQFWCSYSTVPLNVIVTQMGSRFKKTLVSESVRDSLHSWCKRVKERSKHDSLHSHTTRSVCSLDDTTTIDERDEITVASGSLSRSSSMESLNQVTITSSEQAESILHALERPPQAELSFRVEEYLSDTLNNSVLSQPPINGEDFEEDNSGSGEEKVETLYDLFRKT
ncbi:hypothetical protein LWI28_021729 [Acer negundo]|uniref:MLO-like protein n=1 Tax=Acer negundo TaxID=4023 RepID=A0AAD5NS13_ACENE|nr:hypothetical protein LWI28_021729 [Acer negundo]